MRKICSAIYDVKKEFSIDGNIYIAMFTYLKGLGCLLILQVCVHEGYTVHGAQIFIGKRLL